MLRGVNLLVDSFSLKKLIAYGVGIVDSDTIDKINNGNRFRNELFIFMAIVVKGNEIAIIIIDSRSGNDRSAEITTDIFDNFVRIAYVWFCIDVESLFMIPVAF